MRVHARRSAGRSRRGDHPGGTSPAGPPSGGGPAKDEARGQLGDAQPAGAVRVERVDHRLGERRAVRGRVEQARAVRGVGGVRALGAAAGPAERRAGGVVAVGVAPVGAGVEQGVGVDLGPRRVGVVDRDDPRRAVRPGFVDPGLVGREGPAQDRRRAVVDAVVGEDADVDAGGDLVVLLGDAEGVVPVERDPGAARRRRGARSSPSPGRPAAARQWKVERPAVRVAAVLGGEDHARAGPRSSARSGRPPGACRTAARRGPRRRSRRPRSRAPPRPPGCAPRRGSRRP